MSSSTLVYYATPLRRHLEQAKPAAAPVAAAAKPAPANPSNLTKATTAQAPKPANTTAASVGRTVSVPKPSKMDVKTADPALVKMLNTTQLGAGARVTERVRASAAQRSPPA